MFFLGFYVLRFQLPEIIQVEPLFRILFEDVLHGSHILVEQIFRLRGDTGQGRVCRQRDDVALVVSSFLFHQKDGQHRNLHLGCQSEGPDGEFSGMSEEIDHFLFGASEDAVAVDGEDLAVVKGVLDGEKVLKQADR